MEENIVLGKSREYEFKNIRDRIDIEGGERKEKTKIKYLLTLGFVCGTRNINCHISNSRST